jgi:hypothetical protein
MYLVLGSWYLVFGFFLCMPLQMQAFLKKGCRNKTAKYQLPDINYPEET